MTVNQADLRWVTLALEEDKVEIAGGVALFGEKLGEFGVVLHPVQQNLLQDAPAGEAHGVAAQRG